MENYLEKMGVAHHYTTPLWWYEQGLDYIENVVAHHAIIDPRPTKEACVWLLPALVASPAIAIDKRQITKKKSKVGMPAKP